MTPEDFKLYMEEITAKTDQPLVSPRFGDNWKTFAKENNSHELTIQIAWKQGRKAILLERELEKLLVK